MVNLNVVPFGRLISVITNRINTGSGLALEVYEVGDIAELVRACVDVPKEATYVNAYANAEVVRSMFQAMVEGRRIDAIKRYRELTGGDLKDSKDAIESVLNMEKRDY